MCVLPVIVYLRCHGREITHNEFVPVETNLTKNGNMRQLGRVTAKMAMAVLVFFAYPQVPTLSGTEAVRG